MKFSEILNQLGDYITQSSLDNDLEITGVAALDEATSGTLSYIEGSKFASLLNSTSASAVILPPDEKLQNQATEKGIAWLTTKEPRLVFAKAIALFYQPYHPTPEIHPSAVIHPTAKIGDDVSQQLMEKKYLEVYMPALMSEEEIRVVVREFLSRENITRNQGFLMGLFNKEQKGKGFDNKMVSKIITEELV
jgi:hypothetical protein